MRVPVRLSVHSWSMFTVHSVSRVSVHSFIHPLHSAFIEVVAVEEIIVSSFNHSTVCRRQKPKESFNTPDNITSQSGADAEKRRSFENGHRLIRAMHFELFFAEISCDQIKTRQSGTFDSMKVLKPAVSNKQNEAHDAHRPSAEDTGHW